jgi:GNAT superfamily N-acetyltransferase
MRTTADVSARVTPGSHLGRAVRQDRWMSLVRGLQERAARALPAAHVEDADGWWLRYAPGCAWWAGTVLPHRDGGLADRVGVAERFYAARGAVARFQIAPGACPAALDTLLARRGYRRRSPVSLQVAETARVAAGVVAAAVVPAGVVAAGAVPAEVDDRPAPAWLDVWRTGQPPDADLDAERDLLGRVTRPAGYVRAMAGDDVVAVGRVVADTGWAGVFGMVTLPRARGRGAARAVLAGAARWAAARRIERLYLQVELGNDAALRLYGRAGFTPVCTYHYRAADTG